VQCALTTVSASIECCPAIWTCIQLQHDIWNKTLIYLFMPLSIRFCSLLWYHACAMPSSVNMPLLQKRILSLSLWIYNAVCFPHSWSCSLIFCLSGSFMAHRDHIPCLPGGMPLGPWHWCRLTLMTSRRFGRPEPGRSRGSTRLGGKIQGEVPKGGPSRNGE
jgi:hypothetical protein